MNFDLRRQQFEAVNMLATLNTSHQGQRRVRCYGTFSMMLVLVLFLVAIEQYYMKDNTHVDMTIQMKRYDTHIPLDDERSTHQMEQNQETLKTYLVLWYTQLSFIQKRPQARFKDFSTCAYNNCQLTFNKSLQRVSDAVLFDGRHVGQVYLNKSKGQIWVFAAHESQAVVQDTIKNGKVIKRPNLKNKFNWTMTFDKEKSDIWLPYGKIKKRTVPVVRDFRAIAMNKTKGAIIITSHCKTKSNRLEFIKTLQKFTDVTVLGTCGKKWTCGVKTIHDNCFDILNTTYAFYLAFENALCDHYFTEKLFENFHYDILIVTRGGLNESSSKEFPSGSVISTDTFTNAKQLGYYLSNLTSSKEEYAKRLEEKSQLYAVDYADVYQQALCDLCYRMNHQEKFYKVIPDITRLFRREQSCSIP